MEITKSQQGNISILAVSGRLDVLSSNTMDSTLQEVIEQGNHQILLDCEELDFISSSGLRVLLRTAKQLKTANGRIGLCNIKDHIHEVLEIAGILSLLPVSSSQEEALSKF